MAQYRTAQGKVVDMASLVAKNEKTRAVGNMKVNARGDTIDAYGRVIESVTEKVTNQYAKTVGTPGARQVTTNTHSSQASAVSTKAAVSNPIDEDVLPAYDEFSTDEDVEIEEIKKQEIKEQEKKKAKK